MKVTVRSPTKTTFLRTLEVVVGDGIVFAIKLHYRKRNILEFLVSE